VYGYCVGVFDLLLVWIYWSFWWIPLEIQSFIKCLIYWHGLGGGPKIVGHFHLKLTQFIGLERKDASIKSKKKYRTKRFHTPQIPKDIISSQWQLKWIKEKNLINLMMGWNIVVIIQRSIFFISFQKWNCEKINSKD
jgi:hypothetical protein